MNQSEEQLKDFLEAKEGSRKFLTLVPQGGLTTIEPLPINLCEVRLNNSASDRVFRFGGISERFYDKMVVKFDHRETTNKSY